jgi:ABC-2 type transport system permease protein
MREIIALASKDLRILARNRGAWFFTLVWPLAMALFFGVMFSGPDEGAGRIRVALVDEDGTATSKAFIDRLSRAEGLDAIVTSRADATSLVRRGRRQAFILLPRGFGERSDRMFYGPTPEIELGIDPSRKAESAMLEGVLMQHAADRMQKTMNDPARSTRMADDALADLRKSPDQAAGKQQTERFLGELKSFLASPGASASGSGSAPGQTGMNWQPLSVKSQPVQPQQSGPVNAFAVTLPQGAVWGLVGCTAAFAVGFVAERTRGTLVRLQMAPLSWAHLLAGKAAACFVAAASVVTMVFAIGALAFGVRPGSTLLLAGAILCATSAFVGIMMLLSVLGRTEQAVGGASWAALLVMSMVGGAMVPLFAMPQWMLTVSNFSPVKWAIIAFEGAIWRGFSPAEMLVPCGILLAVGLVSFVIGANGVRPHSYVKRKSGV